MTVSSDESTKDGYNDPYGDQFTYDSVDDLNTSSFTALEANTFTSEASTSVLEASTSTSGASRYDDNDLSKLHDMFGESASVNQIESLYKASGSNFTAIMDCLLKGPTLQSLTKMLNWRFSQCTTIKVHLRNGKTLWLL